MDFPLRKSASFDSFVEIPASQLRSIKHEFTIQDSDPAKTNYVFHAANIPKGAVAAKWDASVHLIDNAVHRKMPRSIIKKAAAHLGELYKFSERDTRQLIRIATEEEG